MKKLILLFLLAACSLHSEAQVYDVRGAFSLSLSGAYIPGGWGTGLSADYCFTERWSLGLFGLYTRRKPFSGYPQADVFAVLSASYNVILSRRVGVMIRPYAGTAYNHVSIRNVNLPLEHEFLFGIAYGGEVEKTLPHGWGVSLSAHQINLLTGTHAKNEFWAALKIKKYLNY